MSRSVDKVQRIVFAVFGAVVHLDGVALDRYAALALEVHVVENLSLHIFRSHGGRALQKPVGQRRFAVVDMGYYAKVSDSFHSAAKLRKKSDIAPLAGNPD